jgi:hypothetical protein
VKVRHWWGIEGGKAKKLDGRRLGGVGGVGIVGGQSASAVEMACALCSEINFHLG